MSPLAVLLLTTWTVAASAQAGSLDAVALRTRLEAAATGLPVAAPSVLVLGLEPTQIVLPGGALLGVLPDVLGGLALVGADGTADFGLALDPDLCAGLPFLVQAVALSSAGTFVATPVRAVRAPAVGEEAPVFVLFGQSNAEGYAPVADLPTELRVPMPRCRVWDLATGSFVTLAAGRTGRTLTTTAWCGPELSLARDLAGDGGTVWIVKVAVGQTALGPTPGPMNEWGVDAGELHLVLQGAIAAACGNLRLQGLRPRLCGIAMMQGESDATTADQAAGYAVRLQQLVERLRSDAAARQLTDGAAVPFVLGRISAALPAAVFPWTEAVRSAQAAVAVALPRCAWIETSSLPLQADATHFDTAGIVALGQLFAAELRKIRGR